MGPKRVDMVTLPAWPSWYMTVSLVVLASQPPVIALARYGRILPGVQLLGACCHRGMGHSSRDCRAPQWRLSHSCTMCTGHEGCHRCDGVGRGTPNL